MSDGQSSMMNAIRAFQGSRQAGAPDPRGQLTKAETRAFEVQMQMARSLFAEDDAMSESSGVMNLETGLVNDALMYEALATIARLTGEGVGHASTGKRPSSSGRSAQGDLSAMFESGEKGIAAIGHDRTGGTSYGKYQIASRTGTMDRFLDYLENEKPEWAERLKASGPADTGSTKGAMPAVWAKIAMEDPAGFEKVQHDFIKKDHYVPARDMILGQTGLDLDNAPPALREVLWSTSVQHGATGAARIFSKAIDSFLGKVQSPDFKVLIDKVYSNREDQFASSTSRVRQSVINRLGREKNLALAMLDSGSLNRQV